MTCKHDWHPTEGTERLQCARCKAETGPKPYDQRVKDMLQDVVTIGSAWSRGGERINPLDVYAVPTEYLQGYRLQETQPTNSLLFYGKVNDQQTEVMRISKDGIQVNPDVPVDEAAKKVLEAIDHNIKWMVEQVRKEEREAIAQMIESAPPLVEFAQNDKGGCLVCGFTPKLAAESVRARGQA